MSILETYKEQVTEQHSKNPSVDSITFYVLLSKTRHIKDKDQLLEYLYKLEAQKVRELLEHNCGFNFRKPVFLEKEITTIKFLIASIEM